MDDKPSSLLHPRSTSSRFDISLFFQDDAKTMEQDSLEPQVTKRTSLKCPYLSTIKRHLLDFDFERVCSISLSNQNVYACLVCGKYFQGRGRKTHAHIHALQSLHYLFINLHDERVYCLPDNYEVKDPSLHDIKFNLKPRYTATQVEKFDTEVFRSRGLDGTQFIAGCVGLNDLKKTDSINCVLQALSRISLLRDYFLLKEDVYHITVDAKEQLCLKFSELIKKIWNPRNFKGHVSPHQILQSISLASQKRFRIGQQADPMNFLAWLLNTMHLSFVEQRHAKKEKEAKDQPILKINRQRILDYKTIISKCFRGQLQITRLKEGESQAQVKTQKFLFLTLDLPPPSIFQESSDQKNLIPSVPISKILLKFKHDEFTVDTKTVDRINYKITALPRYLVLHMKRFTQNNFFLEKNPTIVTFPTTGLDLLNYEETREKEKTAKYNLIANILHQGKPKEGIYKVQTLQKAEKQWYEIQDLHLNQIEEEYVSFSEVLVQIYERVL